MSDIDLQVRTSKASYAYGETLEVHYEATNVSSGDLFVTRDRTTLIKESDTSLKVVIGVNPPGIDLDYLQFEPPKVGLLRPGETTSADISLSMPFHDTEVTKDGDLNEFEVQISGDIDFFVELGFGTTSFEVREHDPLYEFVAWQQLARSGPVRIQIAAP